MEQEMAQIVDSYIESVESACMHMLQAFELKGKEELMEYRSVRQTGEIHINGEEHRFYFHGLGCIYINSNLCVDWEFGEEDTWCGIRPSNIYSYITDNAIKTERSYDEADIEKEFERSVSHGEWIKRWDLYYKTDSLKCYYGENNNIEKTAEQLLGRTLFPWDGIRNTKLFLETEQRLHIILPDALKRFYYFVGRQEIFMSSFQQILSPDALWYDGSHLFFAKESQDICSWSVDLADFQVYQNAEGKRYSEKILLEDFLLLLMYYNCAQSGYEYGMTKRYDGNVSDIRLDFSWEKVVCHNGLVIYARDDNLIWFFYDSNSEKIINDVYLASRTKEGFEQWKFVLL